MLLVSKFNSFLPYYELLKRSTVVFFAVEDAAWKDLSNEPKSVAVSWKLTQILQKADFKGLSQDSDIFFDATMCDAPEW